MQVTANPALQTFVAQFATELVLAQVLIRRCEPGYELRHIDNRASADETLRSLQLNELRALAQSSGAGAFRPLKSAPNLQSGWRLRVTDDRELEAALNNLYPGAVADCFAAQATSPPVTHYREFTNRQTGMYRITQMLNDAQGAQSIRAACHPRFCLKRRLWSINGLAPDNPAEKSLIPCLEPCALFLEFARKTTRVEQEEKVRFDLAPAELATVIAALEAGLTQTDPAIREADFNAPINPRRLQMLLEKLQPLCETTRVVEEE